MSIHGRTVYTIGHSIRSQPELLELLGEAGVGLVADVRAFPSSRRHPQVKSRAAATTTPTAIMCAEAVWWPCHRRLIADALVVRDWRVEHLGVGDSRVAHELTALAVVDADGVITYPPAQTALL